MTVETPALTVPRSVLGLILTASLGLYLAQLTLGSALSLRVATVAPQNKESALSLALTLSSLVLLVSIPVTGALSDRTRSRFGRRRPWLLGGLLPTLAATAVIGTSTSVPVIVACYVVALTCLNAAFNAFTALPVELLPDSYRARVMGLMGMFGALSLTLGNYLAAALVGHQELMMTAPVLIALTLSLPLLLALREPRTDLPEAVLPPPLDLRSLAGSMWVDPRRHPDFARAWLARFLAGIGMSGMFSYMFFFLIDGLHLPVAEAGSAAGLISLVTMPVSIGTFIASGIVSDKLGQRKPFVIVATACMSAALVLAAGTYTLGLYLFAFVIFTVGQATYLTVDLALCAAVLPDARDTGKDMAVFAIALSLPNSLVPAVAPTLLSIGGPHNYTMLFGVCAIACLSGALAVRGIRSVA